MSAEQRNLDSLFEAAIAIESAAERAAFVQEQCGENYELRRQLEKLLASDEDAGSFLEKPPAELVATVLPQAAGSLGHSVLKALGQTIDLPQVVLRDDRSQDEDPIERPDSAEIPDREANSRYQLQGEIARGGMGAILKGRDTDLGRDLAIKVLLDEHRAKPDVIQRFVEEAQIGGQLQHPGIAPVYELGQFADQRPFFSMKLVKGRTLSKLLADRKDATDERAKFIGIFEQVCQTMAYAHSRGVIHRDLKPANIMVGAFGEVQVMDWGLAKVLSEGGVADEKKAHTRHKDVSVIQTRRSSGSDTPGFGSAGSETQMGSVMGTPAYMPPEQALGEIDNLDERADVFGLGAILCEILTGQPPYVDEDGTQVYRMASRGKLEDCFSRLDSCGADVELIALAKHCLEREPADRPRDAGVLAERVTGYLESVESKLRETEIQRAAESARVLEQKKRLRVTLALAASVLVIVLGGGAAAWWQNEQAIERRLAEERTAEAVAGLLDQAEDALKAGDTDKAQIALESAKKRAVEGGAESHAERLDRLKADLALLIDLDAVDQFRWTVSEGKLPDSQDVVKRTRDALERYGVDPDVVPVDKAVTQVRTSVVMPRIVAALDRLLRHEKSKAVRALLRRLDENPYRNAVRDAVLANDFTRMAELVGRKDALRQSPGFAAFLGESRAIPVERRRELLQFAVNQRPGDLSLLMTMGTTYPLNQKDGVDDEVRWYQAAVAAAPNNAAAHNNLGLALKRRDLDGAIASFRKAIELDPKYTRAYNNLGIALKKTGDLSGAITSYHKAIELAPKDFPAHYNLGNALQEKGDQDGAITSYRKAIELAPKYAPAHNNLGNALRKNGDLDRAITSYFQAIELDPKYVPAHCNLGDALQEKGDQDGAITSYRKAIKLDPNNAHSYDRLGSLLLAKGDLDGAIANCRKMIKIDPKYAPAHYNLGVVLMSKRDVDGAITSYRKAIELDPKYAGAHYNLGVALETKRDLDGAIASYRKAIELDPKHAKAHNNLGSALSHKGDLDGAITSYRKAIELDPKFALAHLNLGSALLRKGDLDGAIKCYRKGIELDPRNDKAHYNLGNMLRQMGEYDEAIDCYKEAIKLVPKFAEAHCNMASALRAQGRFAEALAAIRRGHELGTKQPGWRYPSATWLKRAERKAALASKLTTFLKGEERSADHSERLAYARIALELKRYALATRLATEALAGDPKLADDLRSGHRYIAVSSAAMAAAGKGVGEPPPDDAAKAELRSQALKWLQADLALWTMLLKSDKPADRVAVLKQMLHWQRDPYLTSIRDPESLKKLPADEQKAFKQLWSDVAALLQKASP